MATATLTSKGQITLPVDVRRALGVDTGDRVEFVEVDLTDDPDLARTFRVVQTPTVLLLDSAGRPRTRLSGTLTRATITEALDALEPTSTVAVDPASNVARHTPDPADRGSAQLHAESRS